MLKQRGCCTTLEWDEQGQDSRRWVMDVEDSWLLGDYIYVPKLLLVGIMENEFIF